MSIFVLIPLYCAHCKPKQLRSIISVYFCIMHLLIEIIYFSIVFLMVGPMSYKFGCFVTGLLFVMQFDYDVVTDVLYKNKNSCKYCMLLCL